MVSRLRITLTLAIAFLVALTAQGFAASRGMGFAVGQMVICTGTGPVAVYIDEQGQPAKPPHYCPEHVLTVLAALTPEALRLPEAPAQSLSEIKRVEQDQIAPPRPRHPARAPPGLFE